MAMSDRAGAYLTIDLDAIAANYRLLCARAGSARVAAVLKADGYGLGLGPLARRIAAEGCREFFVAQLGEAVALREALPLAAADAEIYVLNGFAEGAAETHHQYRAVPVLNTPEDAGGWAALAADRGERLPALLHIDTGMTRLGMGAEQAAALVAGGALDALEPRYLMSHLACAGEASHPMNREQLARFGDALARLPGWRGSLANSAGIFLGPDFHFDLVRPGAGLMGLAPLTGESNPFEQPILLQGKILQVHQIDTGMTVGYGAAHRVTRPGRIATVSVGYGDGYPRALGNRGSAFLGDFRVPLVGRVSMDLITLDVTDAPPAMAHRGALVELIGPHHPPDALAAEAGTIGYEILTGLGRRYQRHYVERSAGA